MARLFFKDVPEGPTCSSCGMSNPKMFDVKKELSFCDTQCFTDWFIENEAERFANVEAEDRLITKD